MELPASPFSLKIPSCYSGHFPFAPTSDREQVYVAGPTHKLYPWRGAMARVAGERGWLTSTEWIILTTWLVKSSSVDITLSFPLREIYLCTCSPDSFIINLPVIVLPSPWPGSQTISQSPWTDEKPSLSFQAKWTTKWMAKVLPMAGTVLHHGPSGSPHGGVLRLQLSTVGRECYKLGECYKLPARYDISKQKRLLQ